MINDTSNFSWHHSACAGVVRRSAGSLIYVLSGGIHVWEKYLVVLGMLHRELCMLKHLLNGADMAT
jgi:hypothetical protein